MLSKSQYIGSKSKLQDTADGLIHIKHIHTWAGTQARPLSGRKD